MKLKRQRSFETPSSSATIRKNPSISEASSSSATNPLSVNTSSVPTAPTPVLPSSTPRLSEPDTAAAVGSPFKKHRASVASAEGLGLSPSTFLQPSGSSLADGSSAIVDTEAGPTLPPVISAGVKENPSTDADGDEEL